MGPPPVAHRISVADGSRLTTRGLPARAVMGGSYLRMSRVCKHSAVGGHSAIGYNVVPAKAAVVAVAGGRAIARPPLCVEPICPGALRRAAVLALVAGAALSCGAPSFARQEG